MSRMFGYGPGDLLGQPARILYPSAETFESASAEAYDALRMHGRYTGQVRMQRRNGDPIWVELSATRLSSETGEALVTMTDITAIKEHQAQVEHIAFHDALTGLANRLLLADRLKHALDINERLGQRVAVCCIDLDGFKAVNDGLGHEAGDVVLRAVAQRLQACVRTSDTVARLGGDEFVLVLAPLADADDCLSILQRVVESVRVPVLMEDGRKARVSASVGVAFSPEHGKVASPLLRMADEAMYEAKHGGKNGVRVYAGPLAPADDLLLLEVARKAA
jgi:diguanylate cyclase (GGDEF)-like protein/PAS domain S-box-containing protein